MRFAAILSFPALLAAQLTVTPSAVTLTPGATQTFTTGTTAANPYWTLSSPFTGVGSIDLRTGVYKAPAVLPVSTSGAPITVTIRVFDLIPPYPHVEAVVTLVANKSVDSCSCKDGKDGKDGPPGLPGTAAGDVFVVASTLPDKLTFARAPDGTWTATVQISGPFLALVQVYRNGIRVQEKDVSSIFYSNGKITLTTKDMWFSDMVSATLVVVSK